MYRLGLAELNGNLGLSRSPREGVKWLKRSAEHATEEFPHALHELALLHEQGIDNVVFVDNEYAAELLAQASELGYAPSAFKLGECYEYGKMECPVDPALSIHYYVSFSRHRERIRSCRGAGKVWERGEGVCRQDADPETIQACQCNHFRVPLHRGRIREEIKNMQCHDCHNRIHH
jgi:TPR repeat protein